MAPGDESTAASTALAHAPAAVPMLRPTRQAGPHGFADQPLRQRDLQSLDRVIADAEHSTGLRFAAYLGDLGDDTRATAEALILDLGRDAAYAVVLAISPGQRVVEIVTGTEAALRVSDRAARLAVLSVLAAAESGDIPRALENGLRVLADQAGAVPSDSKGW